MAQQGFILIADITGYTVYLNHSELEHAQDTLTDLLELLIDRTKPPLVISRLEGDAVISYAVGEGALSAQTFVEALEDTYVAFRRAIELMVLNNTCQCNACANVSSLDLKFFVHHGTFAVQRLGDHDELLGTDVNLIHRLLKNTVTETTGIRAYILCTDAAVRALGIDDPESLMVAHSEVVADLGEVDVWIEDMHPIYAARKGEHEITLAPEEILGIVETEIAASPAVVWDRLNQSDLRNVLIGSDRFEVTDRRDGRVGKGSTYQCFHGKRVVPLVVLDWRPFERVLLKQIMPFPGKEKSLLVEFTLNTVDGRTRLVQRVGRLNAPPLARLAVKLMTTSYMKQAQKSMDAFRNAVEEDLEARESSAERPTLPTREAIATAAAGSLESLNYPD